MALEDRVDLTAKFGNYSCALVRKRWKKKHCQQFEEATDRYREIIIVHTIHLKIYTLSIHLRQGKARLSLVRGLSLPCFIPQFFTLAPSFCRRPSSFIFSPLAHGLYLTRVVMHWKFAFHIVRRSRIRNPSRQ